jgi:TRIAD3 protein (E3 ubiquitin-protein ligase RNF216)
VASLNDELHRAEIEGLERCPSCPFAIPMGPIETGDKSIPINSVFDCQNPNCDAKKTCRLCKFPEHIPLRCNEVEHDGPARKRNIMEEAMSASMIRNCPNKKCEVATMKFDGCNHIICNKCDTHFCYLCRQTLNKKRYHEHFGPDKCKLITDNEEIHQQNLQQGIEEGRRRAEEEMPGVELKSDPTRGHDVKK